VDLARGKDDLRLSCSGKTEKEGDITFLLADVGRRVERELAKLDRLEVMHYAENTLLHLARILRSSESYRLYRKSLTRNAQRTRG